MEQKRQNYETKLTFLENYTYNDLIKLKVNTSVERDNERKREILFKNEWIQKRRKEVDKD